MRMRPFAGGEANKMKESKNNISHFLLEIFAEKTKIRTNIFFHGHFAGIRRTSVAAGGAGFIIISTRRISVEGKRVLLLGTEKCTERKEGPLLGLRETADISHTSHTPTHPQSKKHSFFLSLGRKCFLQYASKPFSVVESVLNSPKANSLQV